ncbi:molybdenum cofactor guanylyltransferase [Hoeflea marina]|uniref:Molybdenum cofactor guanylyltransferase n=1 Tax=Hoeflea marina TaxID=274592 RepID=A0A317PMD0_9HYPH|nr:molybdenum cofactor guanylyltransferase MobA [Hoeflea marina]PWW01451.1 molybdenum cofactor guanylyltransferase [Hoeflea marina]
MSKAIAGLVLAGGLSRRMGGGEKGLQPLGGRPMIARVIDRIAPQVDLLAINANSDPAPYGHFGLPVLPDTVGGHAGPLAGVLTGLEWAATLPGVTHLVTAATDTPFLPLDLVERFALLAGPERIVVARSGGNLHPVFGLWPTVLRGDLAQWLAAGDTLKVRAWVDRHDHVACDFEADADGAPDPFFNANTPGQLAEAERYLAGAAA